MKVFENRLSKIFDLTGLRSAVQTLGKEHQRLVQELENLRRKREDLANAPAAKADLVAALNGWVDKRASHYREAPSERLSIISRRAETLDADAGLALVPHHLTRLFGIDTSPHARADSDSIHPDAFVLTVGPEAVKDVFKRVIDALEIPNEGLPLAQRRVELEKLDKQIGEAEEQLTRLRAEAAAAGVVLSEAA